jgi:DNA-binding NarL/FixJ family response regulator
VGQEDEWLVMKLLLVDDNPDMLMALGHLLRREFLIVGALTTGTSVLSQVDELNPDIILLDVALGDLNGFQVAERLKRQACPSKIVFLSAHENSEFLRAASDIGASGYVFKSQIGRDLIKALQTVTTGGRFFPTSKN